MSERPFKLKEGFCNPNKIFVWKGYGNIDVFHIDTEDKYFALQKEVYEVCKQFADDPETFPNTSIDKMIQLFGGVGCHETFEYGTGFYMMK